LSYKETQNSSNDDRNQANLNCDLRLFNDWQTIEGGCQLYDEKSWEKIENGAEDRHSVIVGNLGLETVL
jgi:hypothetical protein